MNIAINRKSKKLQAILADYIILHIFSALGDPIALNQFKSKRNYFLCVAFFS